MTATREIASDGLTWVTWPSSTSAWTDLELQSIDNRLAQSAYTGNLGRSVFLPTPELNG